MREVKNANGVTTHYVFEGTEPIFKKRISDGRVRSYVYAVGKHLARVDGVIGEQITFNPDGTILKQGKPTYFYHNDHLGSVKAVTDSAGKVVYNADYHPFGTQFIKDGDFDETLGFTGKEYDSDTGLYYFNARWYDSELGRFISEDPVMDPNSPNLYCYCKNNPLLFIDPTGLRPADQGSGWWSGESGHNITSGLSKSAQGTPASITTYHSDGSVS